MRDAFDSQDILQPGTGAPLFTLPSLPGQSVSLADYRGRPVILVFYPADWSPDCGDQLALYSEIMDEFEQLGASLLAISGDTVYSHAAFAQARSLRFPLLSDFQPRGEVGRLYGVYEEAAGMNIRAIFVLDARGMIHWSHSTSHRSVVPGADGILAALESLPATGKLG